MAKGTDRTAQFLAAMTKPAPAEETPEPAVAPPPEPAPAPAAVVHRMPKTAKAKAKQTPTRAGLKHFGGYLADDTLEKIALLRIRLKMDNSQLIGHAIEELYRKHAAKRAFGDG